MAAADGDGRNSPYTTAFLKHIEEKEDISTVFHHISADVYSTSGGGQVAVEALADQARDLAGRIVQVSEVPRHGRAVGHAGRAGGARPGP